MLDRNIDGAVAKKVEELLNQVRKVLMQCTSDSLQSLIKNGRDWQNGIQRVAESLGAERPPRSQPEEESEFDKTAYNLRTQNIMRRWSFVSALLIILFWGIWSIYAPVPVVEKILWFEGATGGRSNIFLHLPFAISRWVDVLVIPLWAVGIIAFVRTQRRSGYIVFVTGLSLGLVIGVSLGLIAGLIFGFFVGLAFGFAVRDRLLDGDIFGATLGFGLSTGLILGLPVGLVFVLVVGISLVSGVGLAILITRLWLLFRFLFNFATWCAVWQPVVRWLSGY